MKRSDAQTRLCLIGALVAVEEADIDRVPASRGYPFVARYFNKGIMLGAVKG